TDGTDGMVVWQDVVYTQVCDPKSFRRVGYGERGTPVYTHLERTSQPMIRLVSGDLTLWQDGPTPCGRTYPHLPNGVFGRIDDAFTVRGENIYPSEIDAALNELEGYGGEHRIIITREAAMDELIVQVEASRDICAAGDGAKRRFGQTVTQELNRLLGIRASVEVVDEQTIPRTDFKARRVIDDREVFRQFEQKLGPKPCPPYRHFPHWPLSRASAPARWPRSPGSSRASRRTATRSKRHSPRSTATPGRRTSSASPGFPAAASRPSSPSCAGRCARPAARSVSWPSIRPARSPVALSSATGYA